MKNKSYTGLRGQAIADESFITIFISERDHCGPLYLADGFMMIYISAPGCGGYI